MKKMLRFMCVGAAFVLAGTEQSDAQEMSLEWVNHLSGSGGMIITTSAALDQSENVIAVGAFRDSIEVTTSNGPVKLVSQGLEDLFVAKIDPDGALIWIKQVGGKGLMGFNGDGDLSRNDWFSVVTDTEDNVYITGNYKDTADFDPGSGTAIRATASYLGGSFPGMPPPTVFYLNGFILKLNSDGEFVWVRTLQGKHNSASGIAMDPEEGTLAVTGYFTDSVYFDDALSTRLDATGPGHIFVAKYDTAGSLVWVKQMGTSKGQNHGMDIAIDASGNILTTGLFRDTADFDPGPGTENLVATAAPGPNIFVSKLNRNGEYVWARAMGSTAMGSHSGGFGIATDAAGNVFTTGVFQGVGAFNPNNPASIIFSISNQSYFLSKLDANGNYGWVKMFERIAPASVDFGISVATDKNGAVYTTGHFMGSSYFDDDITNPSREVFATLAGSSPDAFLVKTDADGNYVWGRQLESDAISRGFHVLVAPTGNLYLSGFFSGNTDFNPSGTPHDLTAANSLDGFVMKLFCSDTTSSALSIEQCEAFELNGIVYEESGSFTQHFLNAVGCDSVITLDLTINTIIEPVINVNGFTLGTATTYSSYQWFLNGFIIPGADQQFYTVAQNGDYRVLVTNEKGCIDTSAVYTVENHSAIEDVAMLASQIRIYPNPSDDLVYIQSPVEVNATLVNVTGQLIREVKHAVQMPVADLAAGMYLLRLTDQNGMLIKVEKLIKSK